MNGRQAMAFKRWVWANRYPLQWFGLRVVKRIRRQWGRLVAEQSRKAA